MGKGKCIDLYDPLDNRIHLLEPRKYAVKRFRYWIFKRWGWRCAYCEAELYPGIVGASMATLDHVIPKSRCGPTMQWNLVPACPRCNHSKGNKDMKAWYITTPFYSEARENRILRWCAENKAIDEWAWIEEWCA